MSEPTLQDILDKLNQIEKRLPEESLITKLYNKWHWYLLLAVWLFGWLTHKWQLFRWFGGLLV